MMKWWIVVCLFYLGISEKLEGKAVEEMERDNEERDKEKAKFDRLISVSIDMRGNGANMEGEGEGTVMGRGDGRGGEHVYMATYDATNVAKQWEKMGVEHETKAQYKMVAGLMMSLYLFSQLFSVLCI